MSFDELKQRMLFNPDRSPKGSWDAPALDLLNLINSHQDYVTTSSCSGRISVYIPQKNRDDDDDNDDDNDANNELVEGQDDEAKVKGTGEWSFVSHEQCAEDVDPIKLLFPKNHIVEQDGNQDNEISTNVVDLIHFRFEPVVIHVTARDQSKGISLLNTCQQTGYRNSGLGLSNNSKRVNLAIRPSPRGLNVPIASITRVNRVTRQIKLIVKREYIKTLIKIANEQMRQNLKYINLLYSAINKSFEQEANQRLDYWEPSDVRKQRKREEGLRRQAEAQKLKQHQKKELEDNDKNQQVLLNLGI